MNWIIDQLIAFLTDLRADPLLSQIFTLAGIPGLLAAVYAYTTVKTVHAARKAVAEHDALDGQLNIARKETSRLSKEVARLEAETPEAFKKKHQIEMRDLNDERAMALAETFIEQQREALLIAFRSRMEEAVRQSIEDGAPAFHAARSWALAANALDPSDRMLAMLADDLGDAEVIAAASGLRVKLKDDQKRVERLARDERLPSNLGVLTGAIVKSQQAGHYALTLFLIDHGLTLTQRLPYGPGAREHLIFRLRRIDAMRLAGQSKEALAEAKPLIEELAQIFGDQASETLDARFVTAACRRDAGDAATALAELEEILPIYTKFYSATNPSVLAIRVLIAQCRMDTGDAVTALAELKALLPLRREVHGARDISALETRGLIAECQLDMGDPATALAELEALLPLFLKGHGARHPSVMITRGLIAECRKHTGDAATALAELEDLLPIHTEVLGARHPAVLATRQLIAECRKDTGDAAAALAELNDLMPLYTEFRGAQHPSVLDTKTLRAACLLDKDDREGAMAELHGVREGLVARKLRPEHRYFRRLDEVEARLQDEERRADEA